MTPDWNMYEIESDENEFCLWDQANEILKILNYDKINKLRTKICDRKLLKSSNVLENIMYAQDSNHKFGKINIDNRTFEEVPDLSQKPLESIVHNQDFIVVLQANDQEVNDGSSEVADEPCSIHILNKNNSKYSLQTLVL
jgi:hypothetical protein